MEIFPRNYKSSSGPDTQVLVDALLEMEDSLALKSALVFCEFPLFREDDEIVLSQAIVISEQYGVLVLGAYTGSYADELSELRLVVNQTEAVFSHIFSKLIRSSRLRKTRTSLSFNTNASVYSPEAPLHSFHDTSTEILASESGLATFIAENRQRTAIPIDTLAEIVSVVEGSKGLIRIKERKTDSFPTTSKVALVKSLDEEIRRFDRDQRLCYMTEVFGPQRITGLAGSGKTVVLAMQAALAHLRDPEARIAFTFYTKSLYQHVKQLITRFYRQFDDRDPDWDRLRVLHAWGGQVNDGLYYYAAKIIGEVPLTYGQAKGLDPRRPFDFACTRLLQNPNVTPLFDYIFVDEAQDFPPSFLRLAIKLAKEEKLVIAYDVFQTIFDVEIPSSEVLFGTKVSGEPAVTFDEDIVLHKCYRNPLDILVCAHAIGFGLYSSRIVQMLESKEHWEDFGYVVESGDLVSGQKVVITRPAENSPCSISASAGAGPVVTVRQFGSLSDEIKAVTERIVHDIHREGLSAEDILIVCADDRNSRTYFQSLIVALNAHGIRTNNLQEETFALRDFYDKDHVTLSTIYKAKGNEAVEVFVVGIDALFHYPTARNRNTIFTAMTRARGWLHVSGLGEAAARFKEEVDTAIAHLPKLQFVFPSEEQLIRLKRDLSADASEIATAALDEIADGLSPEEYEQVLMRKLKDIRRKRSKGGGRKVKAT
jgi:superfamily I DNA and RNA helicase